MTIEHKLIALICKDAGYDGACIDAVEDALIHGRLNSAKTMRAFAEVKRCGMRKDAPSTVADRLLAWCKWRAKG